MTRAPHPWWDAVSLGRLRSILGRARCDVLHLHSAKAGMLGRAARWASRAGASHAARVPFQMRVSAAPGSYLLASAWPRRARSSCCGVRAEGRIASSASGSAPARAGAAESRSTRTVESRDRRGGTGAGPRGRRPSA